jgi:hypothetical protein
MSLDNQTARDGDAGFLGFASRLNPLTLPAGMLQEAVNVRLDQGVAQTRKGAKRLGDGISAGQQPVTAPFAIAQKTVTSITRSGSTATVTCAAHGLVTNDPVDISGATQPEYNGQFIVTRINDNQFSYTVSGTPIDATGTIIATTAPVFRTSYTGGVFAAGIYSSPVYENAKEFVVLAGPDSAFLYRQGVNLATLTYPSSPAQTIEATDTVSLVQAFDRLYLLREADKTAAGYTEKLTDANGITVSGTNAVISLAGGAHGYSDGMRVRIEGGPVAAFDGQEYDITDADPGADTSHIQITVPSGTASNTTAGIKVRRVKPPLYWPGTGTVFLRETGNVPSVGATYRTMRSVGWGSYIGNRLWIPDGRDTVAISDYLNPNLYDPYWQGFRANEGSNDYLVAITPWVDNAALVFMRKSIWLAEVGQTISSDGQSVNLDTTVTKLTMLTNEIGCAARNSIARAGQFIFFYSDSGVYRLDTQLDLKLRGDTRPLSDPINDKFANVDKTQVHKAYGIWFNNRYYLAMPSIGSTTNDLVFAWSALNNQWEFQDIYGFGCDYLLVSDYDSQRRLFSASRNGRLMLLDEVEAGDEASATVNAVTPVAGRIKTRRYAFANLHSKRFLRSVAEVGIPAGGSLQTSVNIYNPDSDELEIGSVTNSGSGTEDYNLKSPIRQKGHSAELVYETSAMRPAIRSVSIEATVKTMADTETRNAA